MCICGSVRLIHFLAIIDISPHSTENNFVFQIIICVLVVIIYNGRQIWKKFILYHFIINLTSWKCVLRLTLNSLVLRGRDASFCFFFSFIISARATERHVFLIRMMRQLTKRRSPCIFASVQFCICERHNERTPPWFIICHKLTSIPESNVAIQFRKQLSNDMATRFLSSLTSMVNRKRSYA